MFKMYQSKSIIDKYLRNMDEIWSNLQTEL